MPPTVDHHKSLIREISSGLCIFLFVVALSFPVYMSLMNVTKTIVMKNPTVSDFAELYSEYPETLVCPCSQPWIVYSSFINIQYIFHQVCSSDFVTQDWISYLAMSTGTKFHYDFRSTSSSSFQALATFCDLSQSAISESLSQFYSNQYMSVYAITELSFNGQIPFLIDQFVSSTTNSFLFSFSMIRRSIQSNALFSGLKTNYIQEVQDNDVLSLSETYNGCHCASSATCIYPSAIYNYPNTTSLFKIPGFYTGCYIIESLLQSNLQCFFNQTCINKLQNYIVSSPSIQVTALNPLVTSRFPENLLIQNILDRLMVEDWKALLNYHAYYNACQPIQCSYSVTKRKDVEDIATMLIGVIGGLIAILNLIVPRSVQFIVHAVRQRKTRVIMDIPMMAQT
jgi:hypothetical protein